MIISLRKNTCFCENITQSIGEAICSLLKSGRLLVGKAPVVRKVVSQEVPQASYLPNFQSIICNGQT